MSNTFIGMLLVFLDINLNIGRITIGLIPDFIGYIIMAKGLEELSHESLYFANVKGFAKGMAVYTGILYCMNLLGLSHYFNIASYLLGLAATIISLYISNRIAKGVEDMENTHGRELNATSLYSSLKFNAVFTLAAHVLIIIPFLSVICMLVAFVSAIVLLVAFNKSKKLYYGTM